MASNENKSYSDSGIILKLINSFVEFFIEKRFIIILIIVLSIFVLGYISQQLNLKSANCSKLDKNINSVVSKVYSIDIENNDYAQGLNNFYIKTAYNCCCTGNFKNDYVDLCALKLCAHYGVRALDFQIYSLHNKPIISASSVTNREYKEIYNFIPFNMAMKSVQENFINNSENYNKNDPLFLIFRLYTENDNAYNQMYDAIDSLFGSKNKLNINLIYVLPNDQNLTDIKLKDLKNKIVIIVDSSNGDKAKFENSNLNKICSLHTTGNLKSKIVRETQLYNDSTIKNVSDIDNNSITILYPDIKQSKINYDFITTGIINDITFIGMNFQSDDKYLTEYNNNIFFEKSAFLNKKVVRGKMCNNDKYKNIGIC